MNTLLRFRSSCYLLSLSFSSSLFLVWIFTILFVLHACMFILNRRFIRNNLYFFNIKVRLCTHHFFQTLHYAESSSCCFFFFHFIGQWKGVTNSQRMFLFGSLIFLKKIFHSSEFDWPCESRVPFLLPTWIKDKGEKEKFNKK